MSDDSGPQRRSSLLTGISVNKKLVNELQHDLQQAVRDPDTQILMEVVADSNGWSVDRLIHSPHELMIMELFLLCIPTFPEIRFFPHLTTVKLVHIGLETMEHLEALSLVEELWLSDNNIRQIQGLQNMSKLRRLYLQGNRLTSMDGLPVLRHLRELWLCRNRITSICGLERVSKLRSFWIADNPIAHLSGAFGNYLTHLHDVNLSACHLCSFHQVARLAVLPCLRNVWFSDSLFGDNSVCRLSNYRTFVIHLLPSIDTLDHIVVTPEHRRLAGIIYEKKRMYYSMRLHTLERNGALLRERAQMSAHKISSRARDALHKLGAIASRISAELTERQLYARGSCFPQSDRFNVGRLQGVLKDVERASGTREVELQSVNRMLTEAMVSTKELMKNVSQRLCVELHTGGNIRLEVVDEKDSWHASSVELLQARFDANAFKRRFGITAVTASRVYRITNRGLRLRFDERVRELGIDLTDANNRKNLICLFGAVPVEGVARESLLQNVLVYGTDVLDGDHDEAYLRSCLPSENEGIPLTNSLYYADEDRLLACHAKGELSGVRANPNALSGRLLVFRTYLGKSVAALGRHGRYSQMEKEDTSGFLSSSKKVLRREYSADVSSVYRIPGEDNNMRIWYCFDRVLILPEFVIDYTYTPTTSLTIPPALYVFHDKEQLQGRLQELLPEMVPFYLQPPQQHHLHWNDVPTACYPLIAFMNWSEARPFDQFALAETEEALNTGRALLEEAQTAQGSSGVRGEGPLTDNDFEAYMKNVGCGSRESLAFCALREWKLTAVRKETSYYVYPALTTLDLSSNRITELSWFAVATAAPSLRHLILHDNLLDGIELHSTKMPTLQSLDLSCNQIRRVGDFADFPSSFPSLQSLCVDGNPILQSKNALREILSYFARSSLRNLDGLDLAGGPFSLSELRLLRDRTLDFQAPGPSGSICLAAQYLVHCAYVNWSPNDAPYDLFSLNSEMVPLGKFERALLPLIPLEPREKLRNMESAMKDAAGILSTERKVHDTPTALSEAVTFLYQHSLLNDVRWVDALPNLQHLVLRGHSLTTLTPVLGLRNLVLVDFQDNCLTELPDLSGLKKLHTVDVSFNLLSSITGMGVVLELRSLCLTGNQLATLDISVLTPCARLEELYVGMNQLTDLKSLYALKELPLLVTLDLFGNPLMVAPPTQKESVRSYLIFHLCHLKVLDGLPITQSECHQAREILAGKMSEDLFLERANRDVSLWPTLTMLDLSYCALREVGSLEAFRSLESIKLSHNVLVSIDGIASLSRLKVLDLAHNKLGTGLNAPLALGSALNLIPLLQSLSLESNHITDLPSLGLQLPHLKFLNLKGNELQYLSSGLDRLPELRELLVDQNKLRVLGTESFVGCPRLHGLSASENAIRGTEGLSRLNRLETLHLGGNRLGDLHLLINDLAPCPLVTATFAANAIARKPSYRASIIAHFPGLQTLDGRDITGEERAKAETLRCSELVAPPNVVIDLNFSVQGASGGVGGASVRFAGAPSGGAAGGALPTSHGRLQAIGLPAQTRFPSKSVAGRGAGLLYPRGMPGNGVPSGGFRRPTR